MSAVSIYAFGPFGSVLLPLYLADPPQATQWESAWDEFAALNSVATPANNFGLPISGANIGMDNDGYRTVFTFVVPDEADLAISIKGEPCQGIDFALEWGTSVHQLPVRAIADGLWDCVLPNTSQGRLARLSASGVGEVTLYGLMIHPTNHGANVASVTREHPSFIDGAGQSGCVIKENEISRALYALLQPWERDQFGISLTEVELFNI